MTDQDSGKVPAGPEARIQVLDSFGAFAILSVILFHILYLGERTTQRVLIDVGEPLSTAFSYGYLGVEFFFIISGFVIFMTVQSAATALDFGWRRFARICSASTCSATTRTNVPSMTFSSRR